MSRTIFSQLRALLAIVAAVCFVGVLFPDSNLIPFRGTLITSRTVQDATQATRWLFLSGAVVCLLAFVAGHWLRIGTTSGVQTIARWSEKFFWGLACGLAFALRLPFFLLPPDSALRTDALWYHNAAVAIAAGEGLRFDGVPTAYRPPGYPTLLALTYRILGPSPQWAWLWGLASTGIILFTTYFLANRLYGKTIARIATLIIVFYPALIFYTGQPMSDLVFTAVLMLVLYIVTLHKPYWWIETIGIGVALGFLTLIRSVSIGLFLVIPVVWYIEQPNRRKLVFHSILLTIVFVASLLPWMLRNYTVFGTPILGTNMGLVLYIGNHANASGTFELTDLPVPLGLNEAQIDHVYLQAAIQFIAAHPADVLSILPRKVIHLFLLEAPSAQLLFQDQSPWFKYTSYGVAQLFYLPILILFSLRIFNLLAPMRPYDIQWVGFIIIAYFVLMAVVFFGMDRYRLPILPWMIIESSVVLGWLANCDDFSGVAHPAQFRRA